MNKIQFGLGQISNQTPQFATWIFRVVLYLAAITIIVVSTISEIPDPVKLTITKYCAEATILVHSISRLFGIDTNKIEPPKLDQ